jgi:hypothetical protein
LHLTIPLLFREHQVIDQLLEHALNSPGKVMSVVVADGQRAASVSYSTRRSAERASRSSASVTFAARVASARSLLFTAPLCPPAELAHRHHAGVTARCPADGRSVGARQSCPPDVRRGIIVGASPARPLL